MVKIKQSELNKYSQKNNIIFKKGLKGYQYYSLNDLTGYQSICTVDSQYNEVIVSNCPVRFYLDLDYYNKETDENIIDPLKEIINSCFLEYYEIKVIDENYRISTSSVKTNYIKQKI